MIDPFVLREWADLGKRVTNSAQVLGRRVNRVDSYAQEAVEFCARQPPESYSELLHRVSQAAELAKRWQSETVAVHAADANTVDQTLDDSFPASDPPAWTASTL